MLKGLALDYYYTDLMHQHLSFEELCSSMRGHFEDENYKRAVLSEWNLIDLESYRTTNHDKTVSQCFQLLLARLQELRHGLEADLQTEAFFHNKLITACRGMQECQIACSAPPPTLTGLISALKTSITAFEFSHKNDSSIAYMTDWRYMRNDSRDNNRWQQRSRNNNDRKKCYICRREGCWSTKHTEGERRSAKEGFKKRYGSRFNNRFGNAFNKVYEQFVQEYEGEDDEESIQQTFQTIALEDDDSDYNNDSMD